MTWWEIDERFWHRVYWASHPPSWIVRFYNTQELLSGSLGTCNLLRYSNMALLDGYATARVHKMPTQNATPFNIKEPFQVPIRFLKQ